MSEEQISALLARISDDADLGERFMAAANLYAAVAIANGAGFDVSLADWLMHKHCTP
jgi:predicted ribosomally synthesized peptide with nif11-like leader